ncbi:MAG: rRNA pseudouridine synthase, partial [Candidatus Omnitrophica bacterium]|nr:rRNA pseudouridine synthase [Candidatus Omnitrophota bacterium]
KIIRDPQVLFVPEEISLKVSGVSLEKKSWRTVLLYKPKGIVTTRSDEKNRPTVFSLLDPAHGYLHPVGRLDMATTGLLLLTNDTRLSSWLTDPVNQIIRTYLVTVEGLITDKDVDVLLKGVIEKGELLKADYALLRKASGRESHLTLQLTEGKNREIRRLFDTLGHEVTALKRVAFGGLQLDALKPGESRSMTKAEIIKAFGRAWCKE